MRPTVAACPPMPAVLGVDVAAGRWVGVRLLDGRFDGAWVDGSIAALLAVGGAGAVVVGVDMPIGLPPAGAERRSDGEARRLLGRRRSSIFMTLPEAVLRAPDHRTASDLHARTAGKGVSQQSFGLRHRILELAAVAERDPRVHEVHPECSFVALAGAAHGLATSKRSWAGAREREALLRASGIVLPDDLGPAGGVPVDDVLDAAAAAWSAERIARGAALPLPAGAVGRVGVVWR